MSDQQITKSDVTSAYNRLDSFPIHYETPGDEAKVQWAARRAIEALNRLNLELTIAEERNQMARNERQARGHRTTLQGLIRLRGAK